MTHFPAPAVHDHAHGVEHDHVDGGGEAEDEADLEGIQAQGLISPHGDEELASMPDEDERDGDGARHDEAAALGAGDALKAHGGALGSAGVTGAGFGKAGRHKQGRSADDTGLGEEDRLQPGELSNSASDDGAGEEPDTSHPTNQGEGAPAVLGGHGLRHVGEAGHVPEGEGDAVEQREEAKRSGTSAEPHGHARGSSRQNAGGHGEASAEAASEEPRGNVADHGAGAAGGEDDAAEEDARPELVGELGNGRDDHPLADAEEESREVDAADQRAELERARLTGDNAHWGSLRGPGEGRRGIVYASMAASGRGAAW